MKDRDPNRYNWFFKNVNGICCFVFYFLAVWDFISGSRSTAVLWFVLGSAYLCITAAAKKNKKDGQSSETEKTEKQDR